VNSYTPKTDRSAVEAATRHIAITAQSSKIIVEKSTVPCRTAHSMRVILEANAKPDVHFEILSNPEFLAEVRSLRLCAN
jgi:UDPglucose 6-dehydrogenase